MSYLILKSHEVYGHEDDPFKYLIVPEKGGTIVASTDYLYYAVKIVMGLDTLKELEDLEKF